MKYNLTPIPKIKNYSNNFHYRNQSCPKIKKDERLIILPKINKPYNYIPYNSPNRNNNYAKNFTNIIRPQKKMINSFSDARLPKELTDLSYDIPENK